MKEFIQKYQKTIVGIGALSVLTLSYFQNQEIRRLRDTQPVVSNQSIVDSLHSELFIQQTIVTRYEVALELLREKDKKAADEFELILTTQTE
jgi:hypothetical protein